MLVAEVRPDGAPLDVRRSSRVEHLEAGCIRANDMRAEHPLLEPLDQRGEQIGHTPGPIRQRGDRDARSRTRVALVQAVQGRVVDVLAHHHVRQDRSVRDAAL